ncbi:MAG: aminoacyl-tRNA hydrolase [Subdoligranulum sp.]|nr:aminoacyl-tRNA hydrolase [Subdoligranulum sp.]
MLFQRKQTGIDWLIVGLGNPGRQYEDTRHNAGFAALDAAADAWGIRVVRAKFSALTGTGEVGGSKVLLLKPQTFMNNSGEAVGAATAFYKLPPERVIVLFDDVSLAPGRLRVRRSGSAGGHNGIKSIIAAIGQDFPRVKIGVGEKPHPEYDLADWVLGKPSGDDRKAIASRTDDVRGAVEMILKGQLDAAMSKYNG